MVSTLWGHLKTLQLLSFLECLFCGVIQMRTLAALREAHLNRQNLPHPSAPNLPINTCTWDAPSQPRKLLGWLQPMCLWHSPSEKRSYTLIVLLPGKSMDESPSDCSPKVTDWTHERLSGMTYPEYDLITLKHYYFIWYPLDFGVDLFMQYLLTSWFWTLKWK